MKPDIRLRTHLIIRRGNQYLRGKSIFGNFPEWTSSPWDAWRTRSRHTAIELNRRVQGEIYLFNPVVGKLKPWRINQ